jgi:membrane fusion protein, multidrug efflux system
MHLKQQRKSHAIFIWMLIIGLSGLSALILQGCAKSDQSARPAKKGAGGFGGGAVPVTVSKVVRKDVPIDIEVVGNVEAYRTVTVKSQVSGELTQVFFHEGDFVRKGDQLFSIDPRTYQAQANQVQANLSKDQAVLAQVNANLARDQAQEEYAQSEATRYANLLERKLVSREQAEQMKTSARAVSAAVSADTAAIQSAQATVKATEAGLENAKVLLGYTVIRSPLDGRTGNLDVKQGNVISPNTSLMTINQVTPIYVTFVVPEDQFPSVSKGQTVIVSAQDDSSDKQTGTVTFIDNTVDSSTGTIRLKATFPNQDRKLWPGKFVRVTLRLAIKSNALVVPNQVVQTGQDGTYVFVVKADRSVESRPVVTGARVDQDLVIEKGLDAGETVVLEGQLRLAPGARILLPGEGRGGGQGGQRRESGSAEGQNPGEGRRGRGGPRGDSGATDMQNPDAGQGNGAQRGGDVENPSGQRSGNERHGRRGPGSDSGGQGGGRRNRGGNTP